MKISMQSYKDDETFPKIVDHLLDMLKDYMMNISTSAPEPGDMVTVKTIEGYFNSRKLITILPEGYKYRYVIDDGEGNAIMVEKIYSNCKPIKQKIKTSECGVTIITLSQED